MGVLHGFLVVSHANVNDHPDQGKDDREHPGNLYRFAVKGLAQLVMVGGPAPLNVLLSVRVEDGRAVIRVGEQAAARLAI